MMTCEKILSLSLIVFMSLGYSHAQQDMTVSTRLTIGGDVKQEYILTLSDIEGLSLRSLPDVELINHKGESKGVLHQLRGVPIKEILQMMEPDEPNPKRFSEFYLVFEATDGYRVVFSWNELFNSPVGDNVWIITEKDGATLRNLDETILLLSPSDHQTGRRHIRHLSRITVRRATE